MRVSGPTASTGPQPEPVSLVATAALLAASIRAGLDVRSALEAVGAAAGGDTSELGTVARALGIGVPWHEAWSGVPERLGGLEPALRPAWEQGQSPVESLDALVEAMLTRAQTRGATAAAELGVRLTLPLTMCLLPAFIAVGVLPLLIAVAGSVAAGVQIDLPESAGP